MQLSRSTHRFCEKTRNFQNLPALSERFPTRFHSRCSQWLYFHRAQAFLNQSYVVSREIEEEPQS